MTFTKPNGGERVRRLSTYSITWTSVDPDESQWELDLLYSSDSGATWSALVSALSMGDLKFAWSVTQALIGTARIGGEVFSGISDSPRFKRLKFESFEADSDLDDWLFNGPGTSSRDSTKSKYGSSSLTMNFVNIPTSNEFRLGMWNTSPPSSPPTVTQGMVQSYLRNTAAAHYVGFCARATDRDNHYGARMNAATGNEVYKMVGGVFTSLATNTANLKGSGAWEAYRLWYWGTGTSLRLLLQKLILGTWTNIIDTTDTSASFTGGGRMGVLLSVSTTGSPEGNYDGTTIWAVDTPTALWDQSDADFRIVLGGSPFIADRVIDRGRIMGEVGR